MSDPLKNDMRLRGRMVEMIDRIEEERPLLLEGELIQAEMHRLLSDALEALNQDIDVIAGELLGQHRTMQKARHAE